MFRLFLFGALLSPVPVSGTAAAPAPVAPPSSCAPDSSETNAPIAAGDQSVPPDSERRNHKEALSGSLTNQGQIYNYRLDCKYQHQLHNITQIACYFIEYAYVKK